MRQLSLVLFSALALAGCVTFSSSNPNPPRSAVRLACPVGRCSARRCRGCAPVAIAPVAAAAPSEQALARLVGDHQLVLADQVQQGPRSFVELVAVDALAAQAGDATF